MSSTVLALVLVASAGCGYALAGRGTFLPAHIKAVAILPFVNQTPVATIDQVMTRKVIEEFQGRGKFTIVPDAAAADALLNGTILSINRVDAGRTDTGLASRYRLTLTMKVTFTDAKTKEVIWSNDALQFSGEYDLTVRGTGQFEASTLVDQSPQAVDRMTTDAARTVVTAIVEAF